MHAPITSSREGQERCGTVFFNYTSHENECTLPSILPMEDKLLRTIWFKSRSHETVPTLPPHDQWRVRSVGHTMLHRHINAGTMMSMESLPSHPQGRSATAIKNDYIHIKRKQRSRTPPSSEGTRAYPQNATCSTILR